MSELRCLWWPLRHVALLETKLGTGPHHNLRLGRCPVEAMYTVGIQLEWYF